MYGCVVVGGKAGVGVFVNFDFGDGVVAFGVDIACGKQLGLERAMHDTIT